MMTFQGAYLSTTIPTMLTEERINDICINVCPRCLVNFHSTKCYLAMNKTSWAASINAC